MATRKVHTNGPLPGHPQELAPGERDIGQTLREETEDAELRESLYAKRAGLNCDTTKAPWRVALAKART